MESCKPWYVWIALLISLILILAGIGYIFMIKDNSLDIYELTSGYILFTRDRNSIWVMDSNGFNETCIAGPTNFITSRNTTVQAEYKNPSLSPDGEKIAFISGRDSYWEHYIYVIDKNGNNITKSDKEYDQSKELSWSPDGTKILMNMYEGIYF